MKHMIGKKAISILLCAVLLLGMLPTVAVAEETGRFILVAEAGGQLVIAPEYISYTSGQSVAAALEACGHTFVGLGDGWISEIDGVSGNYTRSDENGRHDLTIPAEEIGYYRFSEDTSSAPSEGLQLLMTAMAEYLTKSADVQAAAKAAYDMAYAQFVGIDSQSAVVLAESLNSAMTQYENTQAGAQYRVEFSDGSSLHTGVSITAQNAYGKSWSDEGDGVLELPAGEYTFCVEQNGLRVEGAFSVTDHMTLTAQLPTQLWLNRDAFRLSGSYGAADNADNHFTDDEYTLGEWNDRQVTAAVPDTFTGKIYTYAEYDKVLLSDLPELTAIYISSQDGTEVSQTIPFESLTSGAAHVLSKGAQGNTVIYRVSRTGADGFVYSQDYTVKFERIPTLLSISVTDQNGIGQTPTERFRSKITDYTYKVLDTVTSVTINAVPQVEGYSVTINGQDAAQGITLALTDSEETIASVVVSANGYANTYTLRIRPGEGKKLSFVTSDPTVTLEVVNSNGEVLPYEKFREGSSGNRYQYVLVPGETYSYVATANTYYHIRDTFTMEDVADSTIQVAVPTENWLAALSFGTKTGAKYKDTLLLDTPYSPENHRYHVNYVDTEHLAYVWVSGNTDVAITALYNQVYSSSLYHNEEYTIELTSDAATGTQLKRFLMDENPIENTVTIRLSKEVDGTVHYQDYLVDFNRTLTLENISAQCDGLTTTLVRDDQSTGFTPTVKAYSVTVSMAAENLELSISRHTDNRCYSETDVGYRVLVDGVDVTLQDMVQIELDGTINTQKVTITVENPKAPEGSTEYTLNILKSPPVKTTFAITPGDALLNIHETMSGERLWADENGNYHFCESYSYAYTLTKYGYVSKSGTLRVTRDAQNALVVTDGSEIHMVSESAEGGGALTISWNLQKAETNSQISTDLTAWWPNFRGNDTNNAVTDARTPTSAETGTLYWANQIGSGIDADAVGSPIIVNDELVTYAGNKIFRIDPITGQILKTGVMDHKSSFSITPPTYADGMVFVALSSGTVQAFNAVTLESLWIYKDPLGGQPNSPLVVKDGYLYTGFWNSETSNANFVCLSVTDEDPTQEKEMKCASWSVASKGGYYWAGAYVSDDFVMVGTDDGTNGCTSQSSSLLMLDAFSGAVLDRWDALNGDIRSTVVYDAQTDAFYFTSKGGSFYSVQAAQTENGWAFVNKWNTALQNGSEKPPMSTCSPVVYNGRAYVGVSGSGQFGAYSGHNITVIDLGKKAIAYSVQTQGYPQTSGLLTTAYEEESGFVYIYFFDNMTPGKLRVLRDKAGQTSADFVTTEGSRTTAYALFTPTGDHAQYAICSPIVDAYGTVYFKNDSAHLFAFGSAIQKIEVTQNPDKMVYASGETFDPTGMVVTATYENGKTRDITQYVTYSPEEITAENLQITISFPYVMYHNEENGTAMTTGIPTSTPTTALTVSLGEGVLLGDVNMDGCIDAKDANLIAGFCNQKAELTAQQQEAADVNSDGVIDLQDQKLVLDYYNEVIDSFAPEN